jgi:putative transposase
MARRGRIDAPGALHHIIIRGIERRAIFRDNKDRNNFLDRLGNILNQTSTPCYAWSLLTKHVHLLLRTGLMPIATVMRRLLTGYAQQFNRRHRRHGQLFQNRYKSILCEEDPYLLELVRYIHLNPVRAKMVNNVKELKSYPYTGHFTLNGKLHYKWQDRDYVLRLFAKTEKTAIRAYNAFVADRADQGRRPELVGGGLLRSIGGWSVIKALRSQGLRLKGDERILGSSDFVEDVLKSANERLENEAEYKARGIDVETLLKRVAGYYKIDTDELRTRSKVSGIVTARAVLCYLAVRKLNISCAALAGKLNITPSAVSKAVKRGQSMTANPEVGDVLIRY